ncbi:hypothetical protein SCP_0510770 [Sparassis crispa]|uniref:Uncharacterized protein n=1 Tax=Sparassis crispa TaxID=139825 RepID=A0A401GP71_9APHY|nr:hypothetical protein SCP_0510770 [Sparassis crispa]GBE84017.1 hypothetical protein SCP_0510770 [Sparassis crispa]
MTTPEPDKMQAVKLDDGPNKPADQSGQGPKDDGLSSPKPQLLEVSPAPSPKPSPSVKTVPLPSDDADEHASFGFRPRGKVTHGTAGKPVKK